MRFHPVIAFLILAAFVSCLAGCATYKITTPLAKALDTDAGWRIGEIRNALPADMDEEDLPQDYDITLLEGFLKAELQARKLFREQGLPTVDELEVTGTILKFNKGSYFLMSLFAGLFGGRPTLTIELRLLNRSTSEVLFAGRFKGEAIDSNQSLKHCYEQVAWDFAETLRKYQNVWITELP